jgi:hypothetical protein
MSTEWRRELDPSTAPEAAALRIEPRFASAAAAISDLQRRLGWLREIEEHSVGEMRSDLSDLDRGIEHLVALSKRSGVFAGRRAPTTD